jgi:hypothetical protein
VPRFAKDGGKNVKMDGKEKNVLPVSTAEYNPCGWRAWLNGTTVTVGMQNVTDEDPPFVAGAFENIYDESLADVRGSVLVRPDQEEILDFSDQLGYKEAAVSAAASLLQTHLAQRVAIPILPGFRDPIV